MSSSLASSGLRNTKSSKQTFDNNTYNLHDSNEYLQLNPISQERLIQLEPYRHHSKLTPKTNANAQNKVQQKSNIKQTLSWQQIYLNMKKMERSKFAKEQVLRKQPVQPLKVQVVVSKEQIEPRKEVGQILNTMQDQNNSTLIRQDLQKPIMPVVDSLFDTNQQNLNISYVNIQTGRQKHKIQKLYQLAIKNSNNQNEDSDSSSQNVFQIKNKNKAYQRSSFVSDNQKSNIFQQYKNKSKNQESSSDQDNIFEKQKPKEINRTLNRTTLQSGSQNLPLERILQYSHLYKNYLAKTTTQKKLFKKISIDIPELQSTIHDTKIPKGCFFKPNRVKFKMVLDSLVRENLSNQNQYLCKVNEERTSFYYQDLRAEQLSNFNGVKCHLIALEKQERISPHVQYDYIYQRFYLFSNKQQKIWVFSSLSMQLLCKIPIQKHVNNPNMHFCQINGRHFLIILGGYLSSQRLIAEGNNNIQIFQMNKWYLDMKSRIIKLIIGRINPIFVENKQKNNQIFLLLGGNTIAKIGSNGLLNFEYEKQINQSTNMSGVSINAKSIIQLFQDEQHATISNLSVKIEDPFCLHSGVLINLNRRQWLILPGSLNLFQVKLFNKQVNILEATAQFFANSASYYQKRQISFKNEKECPLIYQIDDKGIFHISTSQAKKVKKCCCNIY